MDAYSNSIIQGLQTESDRTSVAAIFPKTPHPSDVCAAYFGPFCTASGSAWGVNSRPMLFELIP